LSLNGTCEFEFLADKANLAGVDVNKFTEECNLVFNIEYSDYHFYQNRIFQIESKEEVEEVDFICLSSHIQVNKHLSTALELLNNKVNPSYRNSVKESISAVEALIKLITNKRDAKFSNAVDIITHKFQLHPALKVALEKIYGYTGSSNGIRHAMFEDTNVDKPLARLMLILCIAFVNYIVKKQTTSDSNKPPFSL